MSTEAVDLTPFLGIVLAGMATFVLVKYRRDRRSRKLYGAQQHAAMTVVKGSNEKSEESYSETKKIWKRFSSFSPRTIVVTIVVVAVLAFAVLMFWLFGTAENAEDNTTTKAGTLVWLYTIGAVMFLVVPIIIKIIGKKVGFILGSAAFVSLLFLVTEGMWYFTYGDNSMEMLAKAQEENVKQVLESVSKKGGSPETMRRSATRGKVQLVSLEPYGLSKVYPEKDGYCQKVDLPEGKRQPGVKVFDLEFTGVNYDKWITAEAYAAAERKPFRYSTDWRIRSRVPHPIAVEVRHQLTGTCLM